MTRRGFGYPLPLHGLDEFLHPADWSLLHRAHHAGGEVLGGNGYVALRVARGRWMESDFPPATAEFLSRFGKLPWSRMAGLPANGWRALEEWDAAIWNRGSIRLWADGKLAATPVWRVGTVLVRLSLLQVVAKLPRAEVQWEEAPGCPLWVRFSGGCGLIAADNRLTHASFQVGQPRADALTGELRYCRPSGPKPRLVQPGVNWPPVDQTEL